MKVLGIISSDKKLNRVISTTFDMWEEKSYKPVFITMKMKYMNSLIMKLPEIIVINFSDPNIELGALVSRLEDDAWLHYFGIIGIFDQEKIDEDKLLKKLKKVNVLTLLNSFRIRSHIIRSVEIIRDNYQIIFQRGFCCKNNGKLIGFFSIQTTFLLFLFMRYCFNQPRTIRKA